MAIDTSVSASMFKTEKEFLRAKFPLKSKEDVEKGSGGKTPLSTLIAKKKYFEDAKLTFNQATSSRANPDKSLGIKDKDGNTVKGDSVISMGDFSYLGKGEEWMVTYSGSGVSTEAGRESPTEDIEGEFTLVGKNNGWNFKIKKADWGPFGSNNLGNVTITETISTSTTTTLTVYSDGYIDNVVSTSVKGSAVAWNSSNVINDTTGTTAYTTMTRVACQASLNTSQNKWYCGRPVFYFDTSTLPSGKTITAAKLKLTLQSGNVTDSSYGGALRIYEWDEFAPDGRISTVDFDGFDIAGGVANPGTTGGAVVEWNITGDLLTNFAANYTGGYGFMLRNRMDYDGASLTPTGTNFHRFHSLEASTVSQRPQLEVTYE